MPDELLRYQRLTRPKAGFDGWGSLWLGPDHILQVTNTMTVENYRRWFFRDIQAFLALHNSARLIWNLVTCGLGALLGLGAGAVAMLAVSEKNPRESTVLMVIVGFMAVPALLLFLIAIVNTALGPTCTVFVQTPHGLEKLAAPRRLSTFERLVSRLQPEVAKAQQGPQGTPGSIELRDVAAALDHQP
jgi:hypothetical protein